MPLFDLPLDQLREYQPRVRVPDDFDDFWRESLAQARALEIAPELRTVDNGLALIESHDLTFGGFAGHPIRSWVHVPANASGPLPAVIEFAGYGSGRGLAHQTNLFALAGFVHVVVDVRGQGQWSVGDTPDPAAGTGGGSVVGFMTRGIEDPADYYYRRVFIDAAMAVDAARSLPMVDAARVAVNGASQGGGIALAVAGLVPDVHAATIDIPFLCHFERAIEMTDRDPYFEVTAYLSRYRDREAAVLRTLSYFDGVNFAARTSAPALFSVATMDQTCPPSTVFAAYNSYAGGKDIAVYKYNDHEGGAEHHQALKLKWLASVMSA